MGIQLLVGIRKNEVYHVKKSFNQLHADGMYNKFIVKIFLDVIVIMSEGSRSHHCIDINFLFTGKFKLTTEFFTSKWSPNSLTNHFLSGLTALSFDNANIPEVKMTPATLM